MIKILMIAVIILMLPLLPVLARYYYLDTEFNNSTITDQIQADGYEILNHTIDFIERSHAIRH